MTVLPTYSTTHQSFKQSKLNKLESFIADYILLECQHTSLQNCDIYLFGEFQSAVPACIVNYALNISQRDDIREECFSILQHLVGDGLIIVKTPEHETVFVPAFSEVEVFTFCFKNKVVLFDSYDAFREFSTRENQRLEIDSTFVAQSIASDRIHSKLSVYQGLVELQHGSTITLLNSSQLENRVEFNHLADLVTKLKMRESCLEETTQTLHNLVCEALKAKRGKNSAGMSVSGGFDSSLLACIYNHVFPDEKFQLYHIYSSTQHSVNEIEYLNDVRLRIKSDVIWLDMEKSRDRNLEFPNMVPGFRPPPFSGWFERNWMLYDAAASDKVETLLGGDGGDQLMLVLDDMSLCREFHTEGIPLYSAAIREAIIRQTSLWSVIASAYSGSMDRATNLWSKYDYENIAPNIQFLKDTRAYHEPIIPHVERFNSLSVSQLYQISTLNDAKYNTIGNCLGIRERKPFLYWPLIKFCISCPRSVLFSGGRERGLFRQTFDNLMPRSVANRIGKLGDIEVPKLFDYAVVQQKLLASQFMPDFLNMDELKKVNTNSLTEKTAEFLMRCAAVDAYLKAL